MYALEKKDTHDLIYVLIYTGWDNNLIYTLCQNPTYALYVSNEKQDMDAICNATEQFVALYDSNYNRPFIPESLLGNMRVVKIRKVQS